MRSSTCRARATDERERLASGDSKRNAVQHARAAFAVGKGEISDLELSLDALERGFDPSTTSGTA